MKINTLIEQTKKKFTNEINEALNEGIPISVVKLMMENLVLEIDKTLQTVLSQEEQKETEEQQMRSQQVQYNGESVTNEANENS